MRIKSKFHDYYDTAQALGQDQSLVFARATEEYLQTNRTRDGVGPRVPANLTWLEEALNDRVPREQRLYKASGPFVSCILEPGLVLFAGKLHPFLEMTILAPAGGPNLLHRFVYDNDSLQALLKEFGYELSTKPRYRRWTPQPELKLPAFLDTKGDATLLPKAIEYKVPIAMWQAHNEGTLQINPLLRTVEFYRGLDAWQAFQELSMFIGNLAAPDRSTVTVSDKSKSAKHGFDEWSFRKMPEVR